VSGARNKRRGYELEAEVVEAAKAAGIEARRVFGSGQYKRELGSDFAGDVHIGPYRLEAKRRKNGFGLLYDAFAQDEADVVCVRADRGERLYVVREPMFMRLIANERRS